MERKGRRKSVAVGLWVVGVVGIVLLGGAREGLADGAFGKNIALIQQDIRGPEQKAVILHRQGQETLILSVKYEGAAGDFAWVVPVPSRPKVEKGDPKVFEDLARLTAPISPRAAGKGMVGAFQGEGPPGVEVLERIQVGVYDVAILAATDETALADWLNKNGYALPGNPEPVLRHYVQKGWFYVAMRIDPKKVEEALVNALKQIDPAIDSLEQAEWAAIRIAEEDILAGRTYESSRLSQMEAAVKAASGEEERSSSFGGVRVPTSGLSYAYRQAAQRQWQQSAAPPGGARPETTRVVPWELREAIGRMFYDVRTHVEEALGEGTLHPISLSFEAKTAVYPLRMTSLNPGQTQILLYVIARKRAEADGFRVRYAQPLPTAGLGSALAKLVYMTWQGGGEESEQPFLTKLETVLAPEEMKDDLTIGYAWRSKPYVEYTESSPSGPPLIPGRGGVRLNPPPRLITPYAVGLLVLAFLVGVLVTLVVTRRRTGKRTE